MVRPTWIQVGLRRYLEAEQVPGFQVRAEPERGGRERAGGDVPRARARLRHGLARPHLRPRPVRRLALPRLRPVRPQGPRERARGHADAVAHAGRLRPGESTVTSPG